MRNRDDQDHDARFRLPGRRAKSGAKASTPDPAQDESSAPKPDTESALVHRLRQMDWPTPPPGVRERCLDQLLGYMDSLKAEDAAELGIPEPKRRFDPEGQPEAAERKHGPQGLEQRHNATRRSLSGQRPAMGFAERPVRLAAVL